MYKNVYRVVIAILAGSAGLLFSQVTDNQIYAPPDYTIFQPPAAGGSYIDPVFGTAIKRLTNSMTMKRNDSGSGSLVIVETEYSTMSPFNQDNTRLLLKHFSYFGLYDGAGNYLRDLPFEINASAEPRWSRKDSDVLYYHRANQLKQYNAATNAMSVVHTFSEYSAIQGNGESDISPDGDHLVLQGNNQVFVYTVSTDTKGPTFDTGGRSFDSLYVTPDNNVTITWNVAGSARYNGVELFDQNMNFLRQVAHAGGHMDTARDLNGDEVLIWANAADATPIPNCANGIVKIRLADAKQTCLLALGWGRSAHVSAPDASGWVLIETYTMSDLMPSGWRVYTNELFQLALDASQVRRIAHHRSRPANSYVFQPRASVSHDGATLIYSSNYGLQAQLGYPSNYSDVYMIQMVGTQTVSGTQTIAFDPIPDKTFGAAPFAVTASATSNLPVIFSASGSCTVSGSTVTVTQAGSCVVTAHQTGDGYFQPAPDVTQSFNVLRAAQTINFPPPASSAFGATNLVVTASATSNLPVTFSASGSCTVSGSTVTVTQAGSCAVTAHQTGDGDFLPAPDVTQSINVLRAAQTINFAPLASSTFGAAPFAVTASTTSNLPVTFSASGSCTVSGSSVTVTQAGSCAVTAHQTGDGYFLPAPDVTQSFNVLRAAQTIDFAPPASSAFGTAPFAVTASATSNLPVTFSASGSCTVSGSTVTMTQTGSCAVTAHQAGDGDFLPAPDVTQSFDVLRTAQTINFAPLASSTFGAAPFAVTASATSNFPVTFSASGSCTVSGSTVTVTQAGSCAVVAHQTGDEYFLPAPDVTQSFNVLRAPQTITFAPLANRTVGATPFVVAASSSSGLSVTFSAAGPCSVSGSMVTITGAGSCTITAQQQGNVNYQAAADVPQTFAIAQATSGSQPANASYRIEQNNPRVLLAGTWSGNNLSVHSGGSAILSMGVSAKATFTFTGSQVTWLAYTDQWSGIARVYIDGVLTATVDTYTAVAKAKNPVYTTSLPLGTHTITVEVAGIKNVSAAGRWVWVDAFDYVGP